jgi:archaellin
LVLRFSLEYDVERVQENQKTLKLNATHQLLVYDNDVNIMGESIYTINQNTEVFLVVIEEIGLEVYVERTTYMAMSFEQNAPKST